MAEKCKEIISIRIKSEDKKWWLKKQPTNHLVRRFLTTIFYMVDNAYKMVEFNNKNLF